MNQICIGKKIIVDSVGFLDFALDENEQLITFENFNDASNFLKENIKGDAIEEFILTTVEAHQSNPDMIEALKRGTVNYSKPQLKLVSSDAVTEESQLELHENEETQVSLEQSTVITFVINYDDMEIVGEDLIIDKRTGKKLVPVLAFMDVEKQAELEPSERFNLVGTIITPYEIN